MFEGIMIGICLMSLCTLFGAIASNDGKDGLAFVLFGPGVWLYALLDNVIPDIVHWWRYRNLRSLVMCPDGEIRHIEPKKVNVLLALDSGYNFVEFDDLNVDAELWRQEHRYHDHGRLCGNVRYVPKVVWSKYQPISKETYRALLVFRPNV